MLEGFLSPALWKPFGSSLAPCYQQLCFAVSCHQQSSSHVFLHFQVANTVNRAGHREQELGEGQGITWGTELGPPMQIRKGMCFQERFQQSYPLDQLEVTEAEQGQLSFSLLPLCPWSLGRLLQGEQGASALAQEFSWKQEDPRPRAPAAGSVNQLHGRLWVRRVIK